ncbi:hypothetical protein WN48_10620 [Eufriesea mexicana]|uniref:Uncharacterized protein n=1 Tax=Eufriesea mexicana TaxID=516756 RepID=A0A310SIC2_9HYME|nr:hypothetical protein WN48_10620 [Eufriesea mexicana]
MQMCLSSWLPTTMQRYRLIRSAKRFTRLIHPDSAKYWDTNSNQSVKQYVRLKEIARGREFSLKQRVEERRAATKKSLDNPRTQLSRVFPRIMITDKMSLD